MSTSTPPRRRHRDPGTEHRRARARRQEPQGQHRDRHDPESIVSTTQLPVPDQVKILAGRRQQPTIQGVIAAAVLSFSLGSLYAWSVFIEPVSRDLGVSTTPLTTAFSAGLLGFAAVVTFGGAWAQREPRRSARVSAAATLAAMVATALATNIVWLIAAVVAVGAAGGVAYATATGVAAAALPRHRGLSLGFVVASGAAGPILLGPLANWLNGLVGWRVAFALLGLLIAGLMVGTSWWLRTDVATGGQADVRAGDPHDMPDRRLVVVTIWAIFLFGSLAGLSIFGHAAAVLTASGASAALAGVAVAALSAGDVTGRVLGSTAGDGRRVYALGASLTVSVVGGLLIAFGGGPLVTFAGLALGGAGYGAHAALVPAVTSDHVRRDQFSAVFGRVFTAWGIAAVVGPMGIAWLLGRTGSYRLGFLLATASAGAGLLIVLVLGRTLKRRAAARMERGHETEMDARLLGMRPAAPHTGTLPEVPREPATVATSSDDDRGRVRAG